MNVYHRSLWRDSLIVFCLLGVIVSGFLTWQSVENDSKQDRVEAARESARDREVKEILACFDAFAEDLAGGLPLVRDASVNRSDALRMVVTDFRAVLLLVLGEDVDEVQARRVFADLVTSLAKYEQADDELKKVQRANPFPDPPSLFCTSSLEEE